MNATQIRPEPCDAFQEIDRQEFEAWLDGKLQDDSATTERANEELLKVGRYIVVRNVITHQNRSFFP